ncbi:MAG: hypothetical protein LBL65_05595 [Campylobacteraceae bacterium]|jgi:hypothetical protein|nr:hypothetical protein [Campylobacteraceae bacterium]
MPIVVYANEYKVTAGVESIDSLDFSDLEKEESYKKDGSLRADVITEIKKRIDALVPAEKKGGAPTPPITKPAKKYIVEQSVLHSGTVYATGEDVTDKIEQDAIDLLLKIGAIVEA